VRQPGIEEDLLREWEIARQQVPRMREIKSFGSQRRRLLRAKLSDPEWASCYLDAVRAIPDQGQFADQTRTWWITVDRFLDPDQRDMATAILEGAYSGIIPQRKPGTPPPPRAPDAMERRECSVCGGSEMMSAGQTVCFVCQEESKAGRADS
jgi:hypothetical protein